ncbi:MAG TPA: VacJ family lipoprotein [Stellaceae bacterium]|nr:VacJ family lipoprotein [Stellaceae bacterium]
MSRRVPGLKLWLFLPLILTLGACATPPTDPVARAEWEKVNDPLEPMNREILDFNLFVDRILIKPAAKTYRTVVPQYPRDRVRNFLDNLGEPVIFFNDTLQGEFDRAHTTFARFLFNTTFGIGGLWDQATKIGLEKQTGDFGQTLYSWGVPDGPYLVLPIFGPSNPRDAIGLLVDSYIDPFKYVAANNGARAAGLYRWIATGVDERSRNIESFDEIQRNALDFYAQLRSLWRQHRASELRHGEPAPIDDDDDLYSDPGSKKP